ncbi:aldo/keto reductase [Phycobium rhodophyticola]
MEEQIETLAQLREDGAVRYLGLSNFAAWQVMKARQIAQSLGHDIAIIQPMYNLVKRQAEVELLPMCHAEGIACAAYSPLGGGLLTGKYTKGASGRLTEDEQYNARYSDASMRVAAQGLADLAQELGHDPATLAAAWVAHHASGPMPILSARSVEQLAPSLAAIEFELDDALYHRISALYPAPPPATDRTEET